MSFQMIAFDADDTLWHSEVHYRDTEMEMAGLLAPYGVARQDVLDALHRIEIANLAPFGYGIKGFLISMIEAAIEVTGGQVRAGDIQAIVELGRAMTSHELTLLPHAAETVARLAQRLPLMLITKGDLMDQERKIQISGLANYFSQIEIVSDKTPAVYARLLQRHGLPAERFLMVGNAVRSDILPVLSLGAWAVHVPYANSWAHEAGDVTHHDGRFYSIAHLGELPQVIEEIEGNFS